MPTNELTDYLDRGARALVLLHERSMRAYLATWRKAVKAGVKLPETKDASYASLQTLLFHGLRAARGYMTWMCEQLGLPDPGIEPPPTADKVEAEADRYLAQLLERWRVPLAKVESSRFEESHKTNWGEMLSIEAMLEHAVMHPQRHQFQLEELLEAQGSAGSRGR